MSRAGGKSMHPNSLKNLTKTFATDNDLARMAQKKSVEARHRNREMREQLKITAAQWKEMSTMKDDIPKGVDVMRLLMIKALENDDLDLAGEYANKIAAYETPKLSSVEATNLEVSTSDLSDEELEAKLKALLKGE